MAVSTKKKYKNTTKAKEEVIAPNASEAVLVEDTVQMIEDTSTDFIEDYSSGLESGVAENTEQVNSDKELERETTTPDLINVQPTEPELTVSFVETEKTVAVPDRLLKVRLKADHSCCIGGEFYHFLKDRCYNVPTNVKRILSQADLLKPL